MSEKEPYRLDVAVIGFGPAGISLACAVSDWAETHGRPPTGEIRFLEKSAGTAWHGDFLLRDTDINHHILRDLVTPRNPRSRFSFAMYLHAHDRLYSFGLLGRPPSRAEWSDYLGWAAAQLSDYVSYGNPVQSISPVVERGELAGFQVHAAKASYRADRLVLSSGSHPYIPEQFSGLMGPRVFHTSSYLTNIAGLEGEFPKRWLVVGSGQSAGEAIANLVGRREDVLVHSVHRSIGFRIGQLGQFPNQAFLPGQIDYFHSLTSNHRRQLFAEVRAINYAGIDVDESHAMYSLIYEDNLEGRQRLNMHAFKAIEEIALDDGVYRVRLRDVFTGDASTIDVDAIVLGTGYEQPMIPPLLAELLPWLELDSDGGIDIDRDYRVALRARPGIEIFANGLSERAHGISDAQSFSLVAMRAERILNALAALPEAGRPPASAERRPQARIDVGR